MPLINISLSRSDNRSWDDLFGMPARSSFVSRESLWIFLGTYHDLDSVPSPSGTTQLVAAHQPYPTPLQHDSPRPQHLSVSRSVTRLVEQAIGYMLQKSFGNLKDAGESSSVHSNWSEEVDSHVDLSVDPVSDGLWSVTC